MRIIAQKRKMLLSSEELLSLSRTVRQIGYEVDDVQRALCGLSGLEQCRRELVGQKETIELTTGRLVMLSSGIREIAELYAETEKRNESVLEESTSFRSKHIEGGMYAGAKVHESINRILNR